MGATVHTLVWARIREQPTAIGCSRTNTTALSEKRNMQISTADNRNKTGEDVSCKVIDLEDTWRLSWDNLARRKERKKHAQKSQTTRIWKGSGVKRTRRERGSEVKTPAAQREYGTPKPDEGTQKLWTWHTRQPSKFISNSRWWLRVGNRIHSSDNRQRATPNTGVRLYHL